MTIIADYFLIFTVNSERQSDTVVEWIRESLKKEFRRSPLNIEGESRSGWVLMDYGDVIVHVMSEDQRAYYRLEELWKQAPVVLRVQ